MIISQEILSYTPETGANLCCCSAFSWHLFVQEFYYWKHPCTYVARLSILVGQAKLLVAKLKLLGTMYDAQIWAAAAEKIC